jgi:toxin YoeB
MNITFTPEAWEDYLYWQKYNKNLLKRINDLIKDILRSPFQGLGKPEPLKYEFQGCWSRRIDQEHRLIYQVQDDILTIISVRYHYN